MTTNGLESAQRLPLNEEGFILNPENWNEQFTEKYAAQMNVPLGRAQWEVIRYLRQYHEKNGLAPMFARIHRDLGYSRKQLIELFRVKRARDICQLAGLPRSLGLV
jgi:TusE/DsrC/DsvC family sulfur relay protein